MGAISDLLKSERGLVAIALIVSMSVLTGFGSFTGEQWIEYTKWIATVYIGSKTLTGAVALLKGVNETPAESPTPVPAPTPAPVVVAEAPK